MFFNQYRSTKATRAEKERTKLTKSGIKLINPQERLLNFQKRQKLKDLLITKFMNKLGIKKSDKILENEINKFVQGEKLTDLDLKKLDSKLKNIYNQRKKNKNLHTIITDKNINLNRSQPEVLPKINDTKIQKPFSTLNQNVHFETQDKIDNNQLTEKNIIKTGTNERNDKKNHASSSVEMPRKRRFNPIYKSPEEELAELEAEFAQEEKEKNDRRNFTRLDFTGVGDEWKAMAIYNKKLYDKQIQEEKEKDAEIKRRTREDLDNQIREKLKKEYEEKVKEKEGEKIFQEHLKHIDELEKEKQEALKQQIMRDKRNRDAQIRDECTRKRLEYLKQRKYEKQLIKTIKEEIEKEKKAALEKRIKENEALKKVIRENELNKEKQRELLEKEKQEDLESYKEMERNNIKNDLERKRYFDNIRRFANKYDENETKKILDKMQKEQKEEDENAMKYMIKKGQLDEEREKLEKMRRNLQKKEIKNFLDKQVEEKRKEMEIEKAMNDEQARIWKVDCKKYIDDEKRITQIIKDMNKRHLDDIMEQIKKRKMKKNQSMSNAEYAMNRDVLEKAKVIIDQELKK